MRPIFSRLIFVLAVPCLTNTGEAQQGAPQQRGKPTRAIAAGSWNQLWQVGEDTALLYRPELLATAPGRAVLFDYGDLRVKSIRLGRGLEWQLGRRGRGPGEFQNPTSIIVTEAGETVVLDPPSARLTVITREGKLRRTVALRESFDQIAAAGPNEYVLVSVRRDSMIAFVDTNGVVRKAAAMPASLRPQPSLSREVVGVIRTPTGYVMGFRWSSVMMEFDRAGALVRQCTAVDSLGFPSTRRNQVKMAGQQYVVRRVDPKGREAANSVAGLPGQTAVLRAVGDDKRVVDIYAGGCGSYRETREFPFASAVIAGRGDSVVALIDEPTPHLAILRWTPRPRTGALPSPRSIP
jgi:hypothetical protein